MRVDNAFRSALATSDLERTDRWRSTHSKILSAARLEFGASGYARANTIEIAAGAGVTERTLFRHFPSKASLFREAVVEPFHDYIETYVRRWRERGPGVQAPEPAVREFYSQLWDVLDDNRDLMVALAAARTFEDPDGTLFPDLTTELAAQLTGLENVMKAETGVRGWALDPAVLVRMMFGLVTTLSMHGEWLFGPGARPAREHLLDQLTVFTVHGMSGRSGRAE